MKKTLLVAAIAGLAMVSCKKDRTCTCTSTPVSSTVNGAPQTLGTPETTVTKLTKVSKKGADCNSGEETTTYTGSYLGMSYTMVDVTKNDCKLD